MSWTNIVSRIVRAIAERIECERLAVDIAVLANKDRAWVKLAVAHAYKMREACRMNAPPAETLRDVLERVERTGRLSHLWAELGQGE